MSTKINSVDMMLDEDYAEEHLCPEKWKQWQELTEDDKRAQNGWGCTNKFEPIIRFNKQEGETLLQGPSNSRIVFGRDRTSSKYSGYGGKAGSHCAMIDLVAGTHGSYGKECDKEGLPILADPNFTNDAARVYISQRVDIDECLGLRSGETGRPRGRSAVAIKADNIRIVAREGIKLVTKTDGENSIGGNIRATSGIDLIAGNDDADMQPLVKGDELVKYLENINQSIQDVTGLLNHFWTLFLRFEAVLANHTHPTSCGMGPGMALPSPEVIAVVTQNACEEMTLQMPGQVVTKINALMQELDKHIQPLTSGKTQSLNPLNPGMRGRLLSKHNHTN